MNEKKDLYETAKTHMRLSEKILAAIPGFRGYKEKELRRESDRLVRNHLHRRLSEAKDDLKDVFQRLSDRRMFDVLTDMDRLVAKFDRLSARIDHASYGYSGFFDLVKIKEPSLDRMIDFDNHLIGDVEEIVSQVDAFKMSVRKGEIKNTKEQVQSLVDRLEDLEETFDKRSEVILGVS